MPTTVHPADHAATIQAPDTGVESDESLLFQVQEGLSANYKAMVQSSFRNLQDGPPIFPSVHGFVMTAAKAYNQHLHLIVRPEDVWFAILTQLSIYVNEHAEELRGSFVAHEGQRELEIVDDGSFKAYDFALMARRMASLIEQNLVDPTIREWIQPDFTPTTEEDVTVSSIIMMGALKKYFSYKFSIMCGLPSVTLLGDKKDWENILGRLERIKILGEEPAQWYTLLVPVLTNFIRSFDQPDDVEVKDFWQKIAHYSGGGSGPTYLSGWITAFCFWSEHGKCMYRKEEFNNALDSLEMRDYSGNRTPPVVPLWHTVSPYQQ